MEVRQFCQDHTSDRWDRKSFLFNDERSEHCDIAGCKNSPVWEVYFGDRRPVSAGRK